MTCVLHGRFLPKLWRRLTTPPFFLARGPDITVAAIVGAMGLTRFGFDAMTIPRYGRKMSAFLSRSVPQPRRERAHG